MDANLAKILQQEMTAAAEAIAKKHGLKIVYNSTRFSTTNCDHKIHFGTVTEDGNNAQHEECFKRNSQWDGIPAEALGKTFVQRGKTYKITGMRPGKHRKPYTIDEVGGKSGYICDHNFIKMAQSKSW